MGNPERGRTSPNPPGCPKSFPPLKRGGHVAPRTARTKLPPSGGFGSTPPAFSPTGVLQSSLIKTEWRKCSSQILHRLQKLTDSHVAPRPSTGGSATWSYTFFNPEGLVFHQNAPLHGLKHLVLCPKRKMPKKENAQWITTARFRAAWGQDKTEHAPRAMSIFFFKSVSCFHQSAAQYFSIFLGQSLPMSLFYRLKPRSYLLGRVALAAFATQVHLDNWSKSSSDRWLNKYANRLM